MACIIFHPNKLVSAAAAAVKKILKRATLLSERGEGERERGREGGGDSRFSPEPNHDQYVLVIVRVPFPSFSLPSVASSVKQAGMRGEEEAG